MKVKEHPLIEDLKKLGIECNFDERSHQVITIFHYGKKDFPIFFRELHEGNLLQIMVFFPSRFKSEHEPDLSRFLHKINRELDLPGLGMDEDSHTVFYRIVIDMVDKKSKKHVIEVYLNTIRAVCVNLADAIEGLANGKLNYKQAVAGFKKSQSEA